MPIPVDCCSPCSTPPPVNVIGSPGTPGAPGTNGISVYAILGGDQAQPVPAEGLDMDVVFSGPGTSPTDWMIVGEAVVFGANPLNSTVSPNSGPFTFIIKAITSTTSATLTRVAAPGSSGTPFLDAGVTLSPVGYPGILATALPTALTDNSTGVASNTIAAGTGFQTLSIYFRAAAITGNVLLFTYTPGYAFKILKISASIVDAITTGAKAATLTTAIAGTPTTGGIVIMSGTYALGSQQASSAAVTANNVGGTGDAITVTASSVTVFIEGGFMLELQIQNTDTANAISSVAAKVNALITAL